VKRPGLRDRYAQEKGTVVQHLDSIEPGWRGCGVEDLASRGPMRGQGIRLWAETGLGEG
jgi:hypothetical protein